MCVIYLYNDSFWVIRQDIRKNMCSFQTVKYVEIFQIRQNVSYVSVDTQYYYGINGWGT